MTIRVHIRSLVFDIFFPQSFQVFPPQFRELPPPCLDLFDLDEQFSSEKVRLAQQTNKCKYICNIYFYYIETCEILRFPSEVKMWYFTQWNKNVYVAVTFTAKYRFYVIVLYHTEGWTQL